MLASARPVDHVAPGELLEGTDSSFGLTLPRGTQLERQFDNVAFATSTSSVTQLVEYFRTRVREGAFTTGEFSATFEHVKVPGHPGLDLRIAISELRGIRTSIELRDTTPKVIPEYPDEESRFRAVGLRRDGKVLDPAHLE